jgi:hypothetical protein
MGKVILLFLVALVHLNLLAQNQIDSNSRGGLGLELGYSYRQAHEVGFGLNYLAYSKTDYNTASLFGSALEGYLLFGDNTYGGARLSLDYIFWNQSKLGFQINFSGELNRLINYGLDGRIGLNYSGVYYFYYGYNFYRKKPTNLLAKHSVGLIFRLNWAIFDLENP